MLRARTAGVLFLTVLTWELTSQAAAQSAPEPDEAESAAAENVVNDAAVEPVDATAEAPQRPTVLVVVGASGDDRYRRPFSEAVAHWRLVAEQAGADWQVITPETSGSESRTRFEQELSRLRTANPSAVWLVLIGHGTFDGRAARFNLAGPDVSAAELAEWVGPLECPLVVLNGASSSAPFLKQLSGPGRVIITATKTVGERNATRFNKAIADVVAESDVDFDKDGRTSLLELAVEAARRVDRSYKDEGLLATEHAMLDDNGDGRGTPLAWFRGIRVDPTKVGSQVPDGAATQNVFLAPPGQDPLSPAQRRRRDELESQVEKLKSEKSLLAEDDYYDRLEGLLRPLAELYEAADAEP